MPLGNVTLSIPTVTNNVDISSNSDDNVNFNKLDDEILNQYKKTYKKVFGDISNIEDRNNFLTQENFTQPENKKIPTCLLVIFSLLIFFSLIYIMK